jgi:hypothetical protein
LQEFERQFAPFGQRRSGLESSGRLEGVVDDRAHDQGRLGRARGALQPRQHRLHALGQQIGLTASLVGATNGIGRREQFIEACKITSKR